MGKMNRNQSILFRLMSSFAVIVTLLVALGLVGFFALESLHSELEFLSEKQMPAIDVLNQADRDLQQLLAAERSLLITSTGSRDLDEFFSAIEENKKQSADRAAQYQKLAETQREQVIFEKYLSARKEWEKLNNKIVRLIKNGGEENRAQALSLSMGPAAAAFEAMREHINTLEEIVEENTSLATKRGYSLFVRVAGALLAVSVIAIIAAVLLGYFLSRSIVVPIRRVISLADRIVDGDLTADDADNAETGSREVALLTSAVTELATVLRGQVGAIKDSASSLLRESSHMMSATSQLASAASEQASSIAQTTATVEELKQTGRTTSENARQIVDVSSKSVDASDTGLASVDSSAADIRRIFDQVEAIVNGIEDVRTKVSEVDDIIATVNKVADQSNLLSVNASIEAAKAGEYGRGFTVVAQEVKNLAEQSSKATTRVRMTLESIQSSIENVVFEARVGRERADAGVASIEKTGGIITDLGSDITDASTAAKQIATSANANSVGLEQIAQAMTDINQAAAENKKSAVQVEDGGQALNKLAENLEKLVSHYKLH